MRPQRHHAYCYRDRRYAICGQSIPALVVEQVYLAMRQAAFRVIDVQKFCEHALRDNHIPVSASIQLADRIVRDCRESSQIVLRERIGKTNIWEWVDHGPREIRAHPGAAA